MTIKNGSQVRTCPKTAENTEFSPARKHFTEQRTAKNLKFCVGIGQKSKTLVSGPNTLSWKHFHKAEPTQKVLGRP
jgi:hypothetical protein